MFANQNNSPNEEHVRINETDKFFFTWFEPFSVGEFFMLARVIRPFMTTVNILDVVGHRFPFWQNHVTIMPLCWCCTPVEMVTDAFDPAVHFITVLLFRNGLQFLLNSWKNEKNGVAVVAYKFDLYACPWNIFVRSDYPSVSKIFLKFSNQFEASSHI